MSWTRATHEAFSKQLVERRWLNYLGDEYHGELCLRCDNCLRIAERLFDTAAFKVHFAGEVHLRQQGREAEVPHVGDHRPGKQPDWSYDTTDSGKSPVDRLH